MYCLRSLGNRDRGFEWMISLCVRFSVFVYRCDELITRPRSPTEYVSSRKTEVNGEVHGGRPRPTGAVVPRKKIITILYVNFYCVVKWAFIKMWRFPVQHPPLGSRSFANLV
jgi:hypothetical protein